MNSSLNTYEAVTSWAESLQNLVADSNGRALLRGFAGKEHSQENVLFWEAVESLQQSTTANGTQQHLFEACKKIYEIFLRSRY